MRILFLISSLKMGGAERVVNRLSNYWSNQGYEIAIATALSCDSDFYNFNSCINRIAFNLPIQLSTENFFPWKNLKLLYLIHGSVKSFNPDVILSFMTDMNVMSLIVGSFNNVPLIISERTPDSQILTQEYATLRRKLYPNAHKVVMVSKGVSDTYPWLSEHQKTVIYNPVDLLISM